MGCINEPLNHALSCVNVVLQWYTTWEASEVASKTTKRMLLIFGKYYD